MEQRYWEEFMKTGGVCDYLGYKMEAYGHGRGRNREAVAENAGRRENFESDRSDGDGAFYGAGRGI